MQSRFRQLARTSVRPDPDLHWDARYTAYYEAYFQESVGDIVILKLQRRDFLASVAVAIAASGSAFSLWGIWSSTRGKVAWTAVASCAALAAIYQSASKVGNRLQQQGATRREFAVLRKKLELVLYKTKTDGDSDELEEEFRALLTDLGRLIANRDPDAAVTRRLRSRAQAQLSEGVKTFLASLGISWHQGV